MVHSLTRRVATLAVALLLAAALVAPAAAAVPSARVTGPTASSQVGHLVQWLEGWFAAALEGVHARWSAVGEGADPNGATAAPSLHHVRSPKLGHGHARE